MVDLAAELPPVKPWEQRAKSLTGLAGGAGSYLDTLRWVIEQCRDGLDKAELAERYRLHFNLSNSTADVTISDLHTAGFLVRAEGLCQPTESARLWFETQHNETVIGTLHASVRFVGELLHEIRAPRTRNSLLETANGSYGFTWHRPTQIGRRLHWLLSAGFVHKSNNSEYQATEAGLAFLELIDLHPPITESTTDEPRQPSSDDGPLPPKPPKIDTTPPSTSVSPSATADEIAQRLVDLSCDGARHKEFEAAVRDAFDFLGFDAEHLSGAGQTDVLLTAVRAEGLDGQGSSREWRYRVTVDSKAASGGKLTSNQVNWPALEKHRKQHDAQFSLLVGPGPSGQLLQFAADQAVGVLGASELAALCEAHALVPLAPSVYFALFADRDGNPRGGLIDTSVVESIREAQILRQQLLAQVLRAVEAISFSFKPPDAGLVHFNLSQSNSGQRISEALITEAFELLASPWLGALAAVDTEGAAERYVPAASGRAVAQRLRWLADAFDGETDGDAAPSAGSG